MVFINWTTTTGAVIQTMTEQTTGSIYLTLLIFIILLIAIALMFGIPLEFTTIIIFPLTIACMTYTQEFFAFGGILIIYTGMILTKHFFIFR